ncbi:hypothetical protein K1719_012295 [Acacia pycnantha]|nr:hypothetical protein K1719_012295 [Acacia pycnantha]
MIKAELLLFISCRKSPVFFRLILFKRRRRFVFCCIIFCLVMDDGVPPSLFVNDGSFMERFKQLQQEQKKMKN